MEDSHRLQTAFERERCCFVSCLDILIDRVSHDTGFDGERPYWYTSLSYTHVHGAHALLGFTTRWDGIALHETGCGMGRGV